MSRYFIYLFILTGMHGCNGDKAVNEPAVMVPSDKNATAETKALYYNLHALSGKGILFGHQDDLAYGVNWQYESGRSDVKDVTGEYPALYGWELGHLELDSAKSLDNVPFSDIKKFIRQGYDSGAVITISWHLNNPFNGKTAWDTTHGSVASILPGGIKHNQYKIYLDRLSVFMADLKGRDGKMIPVLFRPFHEQTGTWFWWCQNACTADEYKNLWKFTVSYLRDTKKLHHLLYVYNTAEFNSVEHYMERYPGDDYVDVVSFDTYQSPNAITDSSNQFTKEVDERMAMLNEIASTHKKIAAFAETGFEAIPKTDWWTKDLLPLLKKHHPAYVLVWRNAGLMKETGKMHFYAPYSAHSSAADFVDFFNEEQMFFQKKIKAADIYYLK